MGDFKHRGGNHFGSNQDRREGGRPNFGAKWGDRDRGPVTMHQAVCNQCGNPCEVPFVPISGKPVYCNNCFKSKREGGNDRGQDRFPQKRFDSQKDFVKTETPRNTGLENGAELKRQLEILNAKMDQLIAAVKSMAIPNPATEEKPVTLAKPDPIVKIKKIVKKASKKNKK